MICGKFLLSKLSISLNAQKKGHFCLVFLLMDIWTLWGGIWPLCWACRWRDQNHEDGDDNDVDVDLSWQDDTMRYFTEVLWGTVPLCLCRTRPRPLPALASKLLKMGKKILVGPGGEPPNKDEGVITWWGTVNLEMWTLKRKTNSLSPQIRANKGRAKRT